ncbi:MAG: hypothetical protein JWQ94_2699 [Tardiphaga sp.]|jgi:hypothetical protein|nr:hypothetical protein [Tardiphaga sp.]
MFDWLNRNQLALRRKLISQNFSAIEVAGGYYGRKNDEASVKDIEALHAEDIRIANAFHRKQEI